MLLNSRTNWITAGLLILFVYALSAQNVLINEVMSSNSKTIADEDGDYPDWVELYNADPSSVNLSGWYISDTKTDLQKWLFPSVTMAPRSYLVLFASGKDRHNAVLEWDTVLRPGDSCRYKNATVPVAGNWAQNSFVDDSWLKGKTGLGYGDGDDTTIVNASNTIYLRQRFNLSDVSAIEKLILHMDYDDGFVAYLNGVEVARKNIGTSGVAPAFNAWATEPREAQIYQGGLPEIFDLQSAIELLQPSENVLAVEVHNYNATSSDMSIIPFLTVGYSESGNSLFGQDPILQLPVSGLHTNFQLKSAGETLILSNDLSLPVDSFAVDSIPADISKGRYPDGSTNWKFTELPSPGSSNSGSSYQDFAPAVQSSPNGGFYGAPIAVNLVAGEANFPIYYSSDGSLPNENSNTFLGPILISQTTVLRARILKPGYLPGPVLNETFFIDDNSDLPTVSITTDPQNLWDEQIGIYAFGPNASPEFPFFDANFWQDWEREAHLELFESDGSRAVSRDCGIKIFGGWSRGLPQKSLGLYFRNVYGTPSLDYPVFPDLNLNTFGTLVLRNSGNDWDNSMMRDGLAGALLAGIDIDRQAYRPARLFINGAYWGIQNIREKVNENFISSHHQVASDQIDLLENNSAVIHGDNERYLQIMDYILTHDMNTAASSNFIRESIDVTEYFDYLIAQIYFDNTDWPGNNIKYWRPQTADGKWRWILYDTDFGFGLFDPNSYQHNSLAFALEEAGPEWPNPPWSTLLLRKLLENQTLKNQFINYFADHLNVTFKSTRVVDVINSTKNRIGTEMPRHLERWGKNFENWESNIRKLETFAQNRVAYLRLYLQQQFSLSGMNPVKIKVSDPFTGRVLINQHLQIDRELSGHYFPTIPIEICALPNPGYHFTGWSGSLSGTQATMSFLAQGSVDISANFEKNIQSASKIVINEINYNSADSLDSGDWIELFNIGDQSQDISGWVLKDENDAHSFQFPVGSILQKDSLLVAVNDEIKFIRQFPGVKNYIAGMAFGLSGAGELIRLYNPDNLLVDSLVYDDNAPWPVEADGNGASLELMNPYKDNADPQNWAASAGQGSPGKVNSVYTALEDEQPLSLPFTDKLLQNFPNPFNPQTNIRYAVSLQNGAASRVRLMIYNALGQKIRTLVDEVQPPGNYSVRFNAVNLASGVYFYKLKIGNHKTLFRKMLLLQ